MADTGECRLHISAVVHFAAETSACDLWHHSLLADYRCATRPVAFVFHPLCKSALSGGTAKQTPSCVVVAISCQQASRCCLTWVVVFAIIRRYPQRAASLDGLSKIVPGYQSDMPAFGNVLSDREILTALAYIRSAWPANILRRSGKSPRETRSPTSSDWQHRPAPLTR